MKKRIAAAFMALVILIAVLPAGAYATAYNTGEYSEGMADHSASSGSDADGSGFGASAETVDGSVSFTVHNIDTQGNPLENSQFYLLKPGAGANGNDLLIGSAYTDEFGQIYVNLGSTQDTYEYDEYIFAGLDEGESSATWVLSQNMLPDNELSNFYRADNGKWNIHVSRDEAGEYSVSVDLLQASVPDPGVEQGYNTANQTLTVVNVPLVGTIVLKVSFEGLGSTPEDMEVHFRVEGPDGTSKPVDFPAERTGYYPWQDELVELPLGTYTIKDPEASQVEGFTLEETRIEVQFPGEEPEEEPSVTLSKADSLAIFNITFCYSFDVEPDETTESTSPAVEPSNMVMVQMKSDTGDAIDGTAFELYDENADERTWFSCDSGYILNDHLDVEEGETRTYLLRQIEAPEGYNLAEESYLVNVSKTDGVMTVNVRVNQGLLARLFSRTGVVLGENEEQLATFTNTRKTAPVEVDFEVRVDFDDAAWKDEGKVTRLRDGDYTFTLSWDDAGEKGTETITLKHGEYAEFEQLLPYGVSYEVTCDNEYVVITGDAKGTVESQHLTGGIDLTAVRSYVIEVNESLEKPLVYVEAAMESAMSGGKFALNNEDGEEIAIIRTDSSGVINILDVIDAPGGTFTLVHMEAPEGYDLISDPIEVSVKLGYSESQENPGVISQYKLVSVAEHDAVEEKNVFLIKSAATGSQGGTEEDADGDTDVNGTTQIELSLDVEVDFERGTWRDSSLKSSYEKQNYEFTLQWKEGSDWKSETKKLKDGDEVTFKQKLPLDTEYRILAANPDDNFVTYFTGYDSGTVSESQLKKNIQVSATNLYTIEAGDDADLYMVKVDATSVEPLEGAKFSLKDEDGYEIETFKTQEDGEIDIVGLLDEPGSYKLKETRAPEDYDKLNKAITIEVSVEYVQTDDGVQEQNFRAVVSHKSVEQRDDGTYLIKNTLTSDNPKTGDASGILLWTEIMVVSTAGLVAVAAVMMRKKREKQ